MKQALQQALAGSSEAVRKLIYFDLPASLSHWLQKPLKPAATLIAVLNRPEPSVLLTVRSQQMRSHKGQVSFPGGKQDAGESLSQCALREAWEEVGLPPESVEILGYLDDCPTMTGFRVTPVVAWVEQPPEIWRTSEEVAVVFEVMLADVLDERCYRQQSLLRDGVKLPFYELKHPEHRIWGATAGMLKMLQAQIQMSLSTQEATL